MEATGDRRADTQSRRGSPAKQSGPATQATMVRWLYRRRMISIRTNFFSQQRGLSGCCLMLVRPRRQLHFLECNTCSNSHRCYPCASSTCRGSCIQCQSWYKPSIFKVGFCLQPPDIIILAISRD